VRDRGHGPDPRRGHGAGTALDGVFRRHAVWQEALRHPLNDRQRKVIARLLEGFRGPMTTSKYAKIAKCSLPTALRDITERVAWRVLAQNPAGGRSTSYRLVGVGESEGDDPRHRES
jgi:Fic family protein